MPTILYILLATFSAGVGSVLLAALLTQRLYQRFTQLMLSFAAGALLSTAFLHLLPEAVESQASASTLFSVFLCALIVFFFLDKAELWHHGHEHAHSEADSHSQTHSQTHSHSHSTSQGAWSILLGDGVHVFGDGVLIAAAFMVDVKLGLLASLAVLAHELPHHMGDLAVLRQTSTSERAAVLKVALAGCMTVFGGVIGYYLLAAIEDWQPYFLVLAASSFVYVALADLIPQLQKRLSRMENLQQVLGIAAGVGLVFTVSVLSHAVLGAHAH